MVCLTGISKTLNTTIYHICGIYLEVLNLKDGGRGFWDVVDAEEKSILKLKFPNAIEHTLQWAWEMFQALLCQSEENASEYIKNTSFVRIILQLEESRTPKILESVHRCSVEEQPRNFKECVRWVRLQWNKLYQHQIKQLLILFSSDQLLIQVKSLDLNM